VAQTDRTTATQTLCLMQSEVEDVIVLEYMQQIDHGEHRYRRVSSTYKVVLRESNPTCLPHKKWAPDCDYKVDNSNAGDHDLELNWSIGEHYHGSIPVEERNSFLPDQKDPVNSMRHQDIMAF
jgi:hypothetical protein